MARPEYALVTGASGGIGRALSRELTSRGIRVVGLDVDWNGRFDPDCDVCLTADVTRPEDLRRVLDSQQLGRFDYAFLNAGLVGPNQRLLDLRESDVRQMIEVNVLGAIFSLAEVARIMEPRGKGSILLVASVLGLVGRPGMAAYGASKGGVVALTKHAAGELAPAGIRVNAVAPGGVLTPAQEASFRDPGSGRDRASEYARVPVGRFSSPAEIAGSMVDICTRFSFATGGTFVIDGGVSAV